MDPNAGNNESASDGVFAEIAAQNHESFAAKGVADRSATDPAATGQTGGGTPTKTKTKTADDDSDEPQGDNAAGLDEQDFSRQPVPATTEPETTDEATEPEPSQTNTETNTEVADDWKKTLPPPPPEFTLEPPQPNEEGQIDPVEYTNYVKEAAKAEMRTENYNRMVIDRSFEEAEKVLPQMKTSPIIAGLVKNAYLANVYSGQDVDVVQIARDLKQELAGFKAEGVQSAKTSITKQKNATVESKGSTQKKAAPSKSDNLDKRLRANDTSAFEELMDSWLEGGKV